MTQDPSQYQPYDPNSVPPTNPADPTSAGTHYTQPGFEQPGYQQQGYQQQGYSGQYYQQGYDPYAQAGYGYTTPGQPGAQQNQGLAIASMVLGIISIAFVCCYGIGFIPAILAMIFGGIGLSKANKGEAGGRGMALAGVITGIVAIVITLLFVLLLVIGVIADANMYDSSY